MSKVVEYVLSLKDMLSQKLDSAKNSADKLDQSMNRATSSVVSFGQSVGIAFGAAAVVGFGQKMIQAGTTVENAVTGLTTLLKDNAAAQQVINNTMEDATKTPFAFEGLLAANKALISAGVSATDARKDVLNLANAIAATGGGDDELQRMVVNMQQIKNTGKATAADIKQFAFAGVNIYKILADATNQPIEKVKDMEVSYDMLTYALKKAHDEGGAYAGGLENMAKNTSVQISNLGDSVFQFSVQMFNDLKPAIDSVISGLSTFVGWLRQGWDWMKQNVDVIKAVAYTVGIATTAYQLYLLTMGQGVIMTGLMTAAQWALNIAMSANPIGLLIAGLAAVAGAVVYAYNHFAKFRAVLWGVWETVKEFAKLVSEAFQNLWHIIHGIFTLDAAEIKLGSVSHVNAMMNAGQRLGAAFKKGYDDGMKDFAEDQKEKTVAAPKNNAVAVPNGGKAVAPIMTPKSETKGATGSKNVSINVNINGGLVKEFKIITTNISEAPAKIRELVAQALLSATNDAQYIAQ